MARTRRQKLAREHSAATEMTYQQALQHVDARAAELGRLPRTPEELTGTPSSVPQADLGSQPPTDLPALVRVADVRRVTTFVMRHSQIATCPISSLSVAHWLPDGTCAHAQPTCPTCAGHGQLLATDTSVVKCSRKSGVPTGVPVCGGTGVWAGQRS